MNEIFKANLIFLIFILAILSYRTIRFIIIFNREKIKYDLPIIFPDVLFLYAGLNSMRDYKNSWTPSYKWNELYKTRGDILDGFHDSTSGIDIETDQITIWINECKQEVISKLRSGRLETYSFISSGNCIVLVRGYTHNEKLFVTTLISKSYWDKMDIIDFNKI